MSVKRYIRLFTEPPKEGEWQSAEEDIENALRRNVERVQQQTGTSEGRRESVYLGDVGEYCNEIRACHQVNCVQKVLCSWS